MASENRPGTMALNDDFPVTRVFPPNTTRERTAALNPTKSADTPVAGTMAETVRRHEGPLKRPPWTFFTNHGHILITVARNPNMLVQDIAETVGLTQRGTLHILADLEEAGYVHRTKSGRRTHYTVKEHGHFRHPSIAQHEIGALLDLFSATQPGRNQGQAQQAARTYPSQAKPETNIE